MPEFITLADGTVVPAPPGDEEPELPPEALTEKPSNQVEDISHIASVTKEDILGKEDGNTGEEALDFSDLTMLNEQEEDELFGLDNSDVMGTPPPQTRSKRMIKRTSKPYRPPPTSLGGMME